MAHVSIDRINSNLVTLCATQFGQMGFDKPSGYFQSCFKRQETGEIVLFVAHDTAEQYLGHIKLVWKPFYLHFRAAGIPEIQDLNVLPHYRRQGIATTLIKTAETLASERADTIGIGVGLHPGYNNAQKLYPKLGYLIDGRGVHYQGRPVVERNTYRFDDDLVLYFTKQLGRG